MIQKSHTKRSENALNFEEKAFSSDTKPQKLAKIMYAGIVRYINAKKSLIREKNSNFAVDFDGERRVNMHTKEH